MLRSVPPSNTRPSIFHTAGACSDNFDIKGGFDAFYQRTIAHQCLRFVDSQHDYLETEANLLLRAVQDNSLEKRVAFFEDVRKCRRRRQQSWETSKVAQIFTTPDEYVLVEHRAVIIRIGHLIRSTEIGLLDIFRAWNYEQSGSLNCSELYGGLEWLGMSLSPAQLHAIFRSDTVAHAARMQMAHLGRVRQDRGSQLGRAALVRGVPCCVWR